MISTVSGDVLKLMKPSFAGISRYIEDLLVTFCCCFFLWSGCCLFGTFPISILNFIVVKDLDEFELSVRFAGGSKLSYIGYVDVEVQIPFLQG